MLRRSFRSSHFRQLRHRKRRSPRRRTRASAGSVQRSCSRHRHLSATSSLGLSVGRCVVKVSIQDALRRLKAENSSKKNDESIVINRNTAGVKPAVDVRRRSPKLVVGTLGLTLVGYSTTTLGGGPRQNGTLGTQTAAAGGASQGMRRAAELATRHRGARVIAAPTLTCKRGRTSDQTKTTRQGLQDGELVLSALLRLRLSPGGRRRSSCGTLRHALMVHQQPHQLQRHRLLPQPLRQQSRGHLLQRPRK